MTSSIFEQMPLTPPPESFEELEREDEARKRALTWIDLIAGPALAGIANPRNAYQLKPQTGEHNE